MPLLLQHIKKGSMIYSIKDIINIINGKCKKCHDFEITNISIDSRTIISTVNTLFFALVGERNNAHYYIPELIEKGVKNFVVCEEFVYDNKYNNINFINVDDTLVALHQLAKFHRLKYFYPVIGITGSNGKTIIKEWLYQVLYTDENIIRSPKSYNSKVGVPLSLFLMDESYNLAIIEAGISLTGEMDNLQEMIQPTIGLITNVGEAHQENFSSKGEKVIEKIKLFKSCKTIFYCKDYKEIENNLVKEYSDKELISWSMQSEAQLKINNIIRKANCCTIEGKFKNENIKIEIPFIDNASIENAILIWLVLLSMDYGQDRIKEKFKQLHPVAMRLEIKQGISNCTIINDSYNSDINSLGIALDLLKQQNQNTKKTLILSDILQSGKKPQELYSAIASIIKQNNINRFIGIGNELFSNRALFNFIQSEFYKNTDTFIKASVTFKDEAILLKGSRLFEFERISKILEYKDHRTVLEINLNNLIHNYNFFHSKLKKETKVLVLVKGLSYGSGSYEIANVLQHHGTDYLGVAFADEGVELRKNGITIPIIIFQAEEDGYESMIEYNLEPEIYNFYSYRKFLDIIKKHGVQKYPIHIKVDTGMNRMGFSINDIDELIKICKEEKEVLIKSVFSHLAASDEEEHDIFTGSQLNKFNDIKKIFEFSFEHKILFHILNSEGILRFPEAQHDMVRLGIGLYGASSSNQNKLLPISVLKSKIIQIKEVKKGETIGYGRKGIAKEDIMIGIVPIGYADGLDRGLSNGTGKLYINGKLAPIIGNICMDVCMIDLSEVAAKINDEVEIFGHNISINEIANCLNTIPYEILTNISHRVKRIYYKE